MKSKSNILIALNTAILAITTSVLCRATPNTDAIEMANQSSTLPENHDKAVFGNWGVETQSISKSVKPGDSSFFTYVNEGWIKSTKIPAGDWITGKLPVLGDETNQRVREIVHVAAKAAAPSGDRTASWRPLFQFYRIPDRIEKLGLSPIQNDLNSILAIKTHEDVARWMADPCSSSLVAINVFPRRWQHETLAGSP